MTSVFITWVKDVDQQKKLDYHGVVLIIRYLHLTFQGIFSNIHVFSFLHNPCIIHSFHLTKLNAVVHRTSLFSLFQISSKDQWEIKMFVPVML